MQRIDVSLNETHILGYIVSCLDYSKSRVGGCGSFNVLNTKNEKLSSYFQGN